MKKIHQRVLIFIFLISALLIGLPVGAINAQTPTLRVGLMGDSTTDEYRGTDNRGGAYASVTLNWIEQLIRTRDITIGSWGNWGEPRRTGYQFNWARSGATSGSLLSQGQHTGLASQVSAGLVDVVIVVIGGNDFAPYYSDGYAPIYNGTLTGTALTNKINAVIQNVTTAVDTVRAAGTVPMIVTTIVDWSTSPIVIRNPSYQDANKRQLVSDAIARANAGIVSMAQSRGLTIYDSLAFGNSLLARVQGTDIYVGGTPISILNAGDEPHNGILGDSIHIGTVLEGLVANEYLRLMNLLHGPDFAMMSETEILANAGLATNANHPPVANNDSFSVAQGSSLTVNASSLLTNDTDADGDTLSIISATIASNGSLVSSANSFTYTPNSSFSGVDTFTYTISDGRGGTATATVSITVTAVVTNTAPVANNDTLTINEDSPTTVGAPGVLSNDTDAQGNALTASLVSGVTKGTLIFNSNGSFTYAPNANVNGTDSFTYRANDGSLNSNTATVTITITAVNDAPVAVADSFSTARNTALIVTVPQLLSNDFDVDGDTISATGGGGASHGTIAPVSATSFRYTPTTGYTGTDTFTYTIVDGHGGTAVGTVTVTINP